MNWSGKVGRFYAAGKNSYFSVFYNDYLSYKSSFNLKINSVFEKAIIKKNMIIFVKSNLKMLKYVIIKVSERIKMITLAFRLYLGFPWIIKL